MVRNLLLLWLGVIGLASQALARGDIAIPYGGRLVADDGAPVDGPVELIVEFFNDEITETALGSPLVFSNTSLDSGVFQISLSLRAEDFHKIFRRPEDPVWIRVTDATHNKTYGRQVLGAIPYALKVPIDGQSLTYDDSGRLKIKDGLSVNKIGGAAVTSDGAANGQVLTWNSTERIWKPAAVTAGALIGITAGAGLTGGTITSSGTIGIAAGGVTQNMLADGAVSGTKIANGGVPLSSLASCSNGEVPLFQTGAWACGTVNSSSTKVDRSGDTMTGTLNLPSNGLAVGTTQLVVNGSNVGIGTADPGANTRLYASGQIVAKDFDNGVSGTFDFSNGNASETNYDCSGNLTFANLRKGGSYSILVKSSNNTQCIFSTSVTGDDAGTVTYRFAPINSDRTPGTYTLYHLTRIGNTVLVNWITGL